MGRGREIRPRGGGGAGYRSRGRRAHRRRSQGLRLKVAVDTNVLVSAVIADGPPRRVLESISEGVADLVLPERVLVETRRVLVERIGMPGGEVAELERLLAELAPEPVRAPADPHPLSGDPADDEILASALKAGAEILVSGDKKHLLPIGEHRGMRIMRPQDFLADLLSS
ncbi:MAG: PIN domain-containing protein [Solirubrobacterales bacterium]